MDIQCVCVCMKMFGSYWSIGCLHVRCPEIDAWEPITLLWTSAQIPFNHHISPPYVPFTVCAGTQTVLEHVISCLWNIHRHTWTGPFIVKVVEASLVLCFTVCDQVHHFSLINLVRSQFSAVSVFPIQFMVKNTSSSSAKFAKYWCVAPVPVWLE